MLNVVWRREDIEATISNFLKVTCLINTVLKPSEVQRLTVTKSYNILSLTDTFIWGRKLDNESKPKKPELMATEIKFMRTAKYTWIDYKRNTH
jgi:hypothetical protein